MAKQYDDERDDTPSERLGREDDFWEPGQGILDELPEEKDPKDDPDYQGSSMGEGD